MGIFQKKTETLIWRDNFTTTFTEASFRIAKIWKHKNSYQKENIFFYFFNFLSIWDDGCSQNLLW